MASYSEMDSNVLVLANKSVTRGCPQQALKPMLFARLVVLSAPLRGLEMVFEPRGDKSVWILGSGYGADIVIPDATLHATHLFVERSGQEWLLTSHPDCWGFYVNDEPVETAVVEHGDRICLGRIELVFVGAEVAPAQAGDLTQSRKWWRWFRAS